VLTQLLDLPFEVTNFEQRVVFSILTILFLWVARKIILVVVGRNVQDHSALYHWSKYSAYFTALIGALLVGREWFEGMGDLTTFLGLLTAGLAIALKDLVASLAGWVFIIWRRPFEMGDRVEIGPHSGDVIDIRLFQFTLMEIGNWVDADQSTGRVVHLPNNRVLTDGLVNYNKGFLYIWNELPVLITFESNWRKAKDILNEVVARHADHLSPNAAARVRNAAKRFLIKYDKLTPIVYTSVEDSGVLLTLRYLCDPKARRSTAEEMWEGMLDEFGKCDDIDFAYPTQRLYNNPREGKTGARAPETPVQQ
jgi:small-conductance mechanosensitive channel